MAVNNFQNRSVFYEVMKKLATSLFMDLSVDIAEYWLGHGSCVAGQLVMTDEVMLQQLM